MKHAKSLQRATDEGVLALAVAQPNRLTCVDGAQASHFTHTHTHPIIHPITVAVVFLSIVRHPMVVTFPISLFISGTPSAGGRCG